MKGMKGGNHIQIAAYCRVSTEKEDQANSFESQQRYFREYIERREGDSLYEIYADEGISGTSTKKRRAFNRMIEDAMAGKFQLIITKEISRFARNTLDSIYYTRKLKRQGVGIIFLNDGIHTMDSDGELRLTILASIAQEESRRTSQRVKWGQKRRMEQGVVFGRSMLGYDVKQGSIKLNEDGAAIVRLIFDKCLLEGKGTYVIARELTEEGIPSMQGNVWSSSVILRILRNEKYCGDLLQKKTFTPDYLTHEKRYNHGQEEYVFIRNHHEPIINRETFQKVQVILDARSTKKKGKEAVSRHSNRYTLSGKIRCMYCNRTYTARSRIRQDKSEYLVWHCAHKQECVYEEEGKKVQIEGRIWNQDLMEILTQVTERLPIPHEAMAHRLEEVRKRYRRSIEKERDRQREEYRQKEEYKQKEEYSQVGCKENQKRYGKYLDQQELQLHNINISNEDCQSRKQEINRLIQLYQIGYFNEEEFQKAMGKLETAYGEYAGEENEKERTKEKSVDGEISAYGSKIGEEKWNIEENEKLTMCDKGQRKQQNGDEKKQCIKQQMNNIGYTEFIKQIIVREQSIAIYYNGLKEPVNVEVVRSMRL